MIVRGPAQGGAHEHSPDPAATKFVRNSRVDQHETVAVEAVVECRDGTVFFEDESMLVAAVDDCVRVRDRTGRGLASFPAGS
jgi:hypothetical protein